MAGHPFDQAFSLVKGINRFAKKIIKQLHEHTLFKLIINEEITAIEKKSP
jgi:hypothetical protein